MSQKSLFICTRRRKKSCYLRNNNKKKKQAPTEEETGLLPLHNLFTATSYIRIYEYYVFPDENNGAGGLIHKLQHSRTDDGNNNNNEWNLQFRSVAQRKEWNG
jgi:hypothetical protein